MERTGGLTSSSLSSLPSAVRFMRLRSWSSRNARSRRIFMMARSRRCRRSSILSLAASTSFRRFFSSIHLR